MLSGCRVRHSVFDGNRAWYLLEFSNSAGDGSFGTNRCCLFISSSNLGFCPDVIDLLRVALTVQTNCSARPFDCGYLNDDSVGKTTILWQSSWTLGSQIEDCHNS